MFIKETEALRSSYPDFVDTIFYGRPTKRYICPCCHTERRKLVLAFRRHDLRKEIHNQYDLNQPVCQNCFEFKVSRDLMNEFYGTNIY